MSQITPTTNIAGAAKPVPSIWMFLAADSISFAVFFVVFMTERLKQPVLFTESAHSLNAGLGFSNTLILISGSWLVALAVAAARLGQGLKTQRLLIGAIAVSSLFAMIKVYEYSGKINAGITPVTNDFFALYYALTGFHLVHYLLGMAALIYMAVFARKGVTNDPRYMLRLESAALFWHLVDLLWIFLFAMIYLLGVQL